MSTAFIGTWTMESGENLNAYLRQLGMALSKRKTEINNNPKLVFTNDGNNWCIAIDMKTKGTETIFAPGKEIDTSNELKFVFDARFYFDARRNTKSVFNFESPTKLVQKMQFLDTEESQVITREIDENGNLLETMEMNGVKASRLYKKTG